MIAISSPPPPSGWRRLFAEGVVIVFSILLAFGIEASWTASRDRAMIRSQLTTVEAELEANRIALAGALETTQQSLEALRTIVDVISPAGSVMSSDSLATLFRAGFSPGAVDLEIGALAQLLSDGDFQATVRPELYRALLAFRTTAERFSDTQDEFRRRRELVINYLAGVAPVAFLSATTGAHSPTDFPIPVEALLRDRELEGLVGDLARLAQNVDRRGGTLMELADSIRAILSQGAAS